MNTKRLLLLIYFRLYIDVLSPTLCYTSAYTCWTFILFCLLYTLLEQISQQRRHSHRDSQSARKKRLSICLCLLPSSSHLRLLRFTCGGCGWDGQTQINPCGEKFFLGAGRPFCHPPPTWLTVWVGWQAGRSKIMAADADCAHSSEEEL